MACDYQGVIELLDNQRDRMQNNGIDTQGVITR